MPQTICFRIRVTYGRFPCMCVIQTKRVNLVFDVSIIERVGGGRMTLSGFGDVIA